MGNCYCQHDCFCMTMIDSTEVTTMTLDSLRELPSPCGEDGDYEEEWSDEWETEWDYTEPFVDTVPEPVVNDSTWSSSATYTAGDVVSWNGNDYEAKWWTQGENPENSG